MHQMESQYLGELRVKSSHLKSKSEIISDAPLDNQGKGESFSPTDLLCVSLASCALTIMGIKAKDSGIDIIGLNSLIKKTMADNPRRVSAIQINFTLSLEKIKKLSSKDKTILERTALSCPVFLSLHEDIDVKFIFPWAEIQ
jgi:putative redox protein